MKNELLPVTVTTVWMDREGIMLAEVSQAGEDKHRTISFICKILKSKTNKSRQKQTHRYRAIWWWPEGRQWEDGRDRGKD